MPSTHKTHLHSLLTTKESKYIINPEEANTYLDYVCSMGTYTPDLQRRQTKIMCSIGPSSRSVEIITKLLENGMDIARIMMGRGSLEYHAETIDIIRSSVKYYSNQYGRPNCLAIAVDLKGAEIRTGSLDPEHTEVELKVGSIVKVTTDKFYSDKCSDQVIYIDYDNLTKVITERRRILLDQGVIAIEVTKIYGHNLDCTVLVGGKLQNHLEVNIPGVSIDLPHLTERDKSDLDFSVQQEVDIIFASFVRTREGVQQIRNFMGEKGKRIIVISKVENQQGLDNFTDILSVSDGILVARGDIGVEIAMEKVFLAQKYQVSTCNQVGKPVVIASQLMDSMTKNSRPSRSEAADVANAVEDGADVLALSTETAVGLYPVECLATVASICVEAESTIWRKQVLLDMMNLDKGPLEANDALAMCAVQASVKCETSAIIVVTGVKR